MAAANMSPDPAIAVIIPCHNGAAWLADALRSVQRQTRPAQEIVVVDDGSTDRSAAVAADCGVRCARQAQAGPGAARNHGLRLTQAPLVAFLDADDQFTPDKLERQIEHLRAASAVASCADAWILRDGKRERRKNVGRQVPAVLTFEHLIAGNPVICSSVLAQRAAVEQAGGFDEDRELIATEDWDLWLRLTRLGTFAYLDAPLVDYRVNPGSLSDDARFAGGVDRILAKFEREAAASPALAELIGQRRASVRLDAAWQLARRGRGREARMWLAAAASQGAPLARRWRIWLWSWWQRTAHGAGR